MVVAFDGSVVLVDEVVVAPSGVVALGVVGLRGGAGAGPVRPPPPGTVVPAGGWVVAVGGRVVVGVGGAATASVPSVAARGVPPVP